MNPPRQNPNTPSLERTRFLPCGQGRPARTRDGVSRSSAPMVKAYSPQKAGFATTGVGPDNCYSLCRRQTFCQPASSLGAATKEVRCTIRRLDRAYLRDGLLLAVLLGFSNCPLFFTGTTPLSLFWLFLWASPPSAPGVKVSTVKYSFDRPPRGFIWIACQFTPSFLSAHSSHSCQLTPLVLPSQITDPVDTSFPGYSFEVKVSTVDVGFDPLCSGLALPVSS